MFNSIRHAGKEEGRVERERERQKEEGNESESCKLSGGTSAALFLAPQSSI